jgi:hypothetical protein
LYQGGKNERISLWLEHFAFGTLSIQTSCIPGIFQFGKPKAIEFFKRRFLKSMDHHPHDGPTIHAGPI